GVALWGYFILSTFFIRLFSISGFSPTSLGVFWFIGGVLYFMVELFNGQHAFATTILPFVLSGVLLLIQPWKKEKYSFPQVVFLLILFAGHTSAQLYSSLEIKEKEKQEVYAKKLISDKDLNTEIEYSQLAPILKNHPILIDVFNNPENV